MQPELTKCRVTQTDLAGAAVNITQLSDDQLEIREYNVVSSNPTVGKSPWTTEPSRVQRSSSSILKPQLRKSPQRSAPSPLNHEPSSTAQTQGIQTLVERPEYHMNRSYFSRALLRFGLKVTYEVGFYFC